MATHARRRAQGKHAAGRVPYGFTLRDGVLVKDPDQQVAIARMRELRAEGRSYRAVRERLEMSSNRSLATRLLTLGFS
jgi:hypothetical protein